MTNLFLIKIGEIALKGGNRKMFENQLKSNIKRRLKGHIEYLDVKTGRYYLKTKDISEQEVTTALKQIFGIVSFAKCYETEKNVESILKATETIYHNYVEETGDKKFSFKAETRRADKGFETSSYDLNCEVGNHIATKFPGTFVKVKNYDLKISIEIREKAFIYGNDIKSGGGLPVGTAGIGTLLLSGGIDSPVAGYMMAKRGLKLDAVYFHTYPYTSDESMDKVKALAEKIAPYCGGINLFCVNFTEPQLYIKKESPEELTTILSRSCMMEIATKIAEERGSVALVTGEALSQVASQTAQSLRVTGSHTTLPVLRPCIGMDKEEIIKISRDINTFETSILPFDDCCTLFSPTHPDTKPKFERLKKDWYKLQDIQPMIDKCAEEAERFYFHVTGK